MNIPKSVFDKLWSAGALMDPDECMALATYASDVSRVHEIVELGSWAGGSAAWLCAGSAYGLGAHITCVDHWRDWVDPPPEQTMWRGEDAFEHFLQVTDATRLTALRAESLQVAPMWTRPIGMLFIDACHTFEDAMADYEAWSPHIVEGGTLAVHDYMTNPTPERREKYWWTEGPTRAVEQIAQTGLWEPLEVVDWTWLARRR